MSKRTVLLFILILMLPAYGQEQADDLNNYKFKCDEEIKKNTKFCRIYDVNSNIVEDGEFWKDVRHDVHTFYYENGSVMIIADFKKGKLHGKFDGWHPNGAPSIEGYFYKNKECGRWKCFGLDGLPVQCEQANKKRCVIKSDGAKCKPCKFKKRKRRRR